MRIFKAESIKDVFIHLGIILCIFIALILLFFFVYLPMETKHGEYITVPKLEGMQVNEIEKMLSEKGLRMEINDSTFKPDAKPFTVLSQHPLPGSQVKENRRIYITIAALNPPNLKMPELLDQSLRQAEMTLKGMGLQLGAVTTAPNPYNVVLKQLYKGKEIKQGTSIPKGAKIDIIVGSGPGSSEVELPDLLNKTIEDAKGTLENYSLVLGPVVYDETSAKPDGIIIKQQPAYETGKKIRSGEMVYIWISGSNPEMPE